MDNKKIGKPRIIYYEQAEPIKLKPSISNMFPHQFVFVHLYLTPRMKKARSHKLIGLRNQQNKGSS